MYASDGVCPIGGVNEVGIGRPNPNDPTTPTLEPARLPLAARNMAPNGSMKPAFQAPVLRYPWQKPDNKGPGIVGRWLHKFAKLEAPEPTRGNNIPTPQERVKVLSGMPNNHPDPEHRGLTFESVDTSGTNFSQPGSVDIVGADNVGPQDIGNTPEDGLTDDFSKLRQDYRTNEHEYLTAYRASFPSSTVDQAPAFARSIVLQQVNGTGNYVGELHIPSAAVTARITWTQAAMNDLWMSLSSSAFVPLSTNQPGTGGGITQASASNDGMILNPDMTKNYMVKNKRSIAFCSLNPCIVNVSFYMQA